MKRDQLRDSRPPFYQIDHDLLDRSLSAYAIAGYNVLARHADRQRQCFPSVRHIAKLLSIGVGSVRRALDDLIAVKAIRQTPRTDEHGDRTSNLYELLPLWKGGCSATDTPVPPQIHGVPLQTHGCSATDTELDPIELEPMKEREASARDPLWVRFTQGFRTRYGHIPRRSSSQKRGWMELVGMHTPGLLAAKIDAWWGHPLPHNFVGNRTVGAFVQWFDDISVPSAEPAHTTLPVADWRSEMLEGTPLGVRKLQELFDDVTEPDARVRTLVQGGYAHDDNDAQRIVDVCDTALARG